MIGRLAVGLAVLTSIQDMIVRIAHRRQRDCLHHENSRVSGEGHPCEARRAGAAGEVVFDAAEAREAAKRLGGGVVVVKAQIHAGGRGKGGGVKVVKSADEAEAAATKMHRHEAGHPPDRPGRAEGAARAGRAGAQDQAGAVSRHRDRPVDASARSSWSARKAASRSKRSPRKRRRRSSRTSSTRPPGLSAFQTRKLAFALGLEGPQIAQAAKFMTALWDAFKATDASLVEINPLDRHRRRQPPGARREDELRRQRAVPPRRPQGPARPGRRRPARGRGLEVLAQLHQARRHDRLHGQRRRPRDGDDGHHQAGRRRAGELPRRRRRRQRRADQERLPDPDVRQEREGGADQYLRRHSAVRHPRRRGHRGGEGPRRPRADRDPDGRHQRREGQADAPRQRPELHHRRHDERGGRPGRRAG